MTWVPDSERYDTMLYRRCGRSGLLLPAISLGLWQNFGSRRAHWSCPAPYCDVPLTWGSRTSTWPTTTGHLTGQQKSRSAG